MSKKQMVGHNMRSNYRMTHLAISDIVRTWTSCKSTSTITLYRKSIGFIHSDPKLDSIVECLETKIRIVRVVLHCL
ncbi:hypothetical protein PanWU01x14_037960 [Parasponia andersonii]|uniref:Uncharacterized protein n=1 Tax=Parasponia andersonii TaxID=3476 RepID=A0A2P5DS18_PARAD|nr:hypothetical protein PanWU01x14_037960 [Parasponia andersonii]